MDKAAPAPLSPWLKFALHVGPLLVLVAVTIEADLVTAAAPFAVASVIATAVLYRLQRKLSRWLIASTLAVVILAALTWWFGDAGVFELRGTLASAAMGLVLLIGLALGRQPLRVVLDDELELDDEGWRKLTLRLGLFLLFVAAANEVARRMVSDEGYAVARTLMSLPLAIVFLLTQLPLLKRHALEPRDGAGS
jgi:intracellular septation protein